VRLAISWLTNALVLAIVALVLSRVHVTSAGELLAAAAVFGVLNTVLKPLLRFATLPLALLTFGVAWFFVAMLMLVITKSIVGGFEIHGFWTLVAATLIVWAVNLLLDLRRRSAQGGLWARANASARRRGAFGSPPRSGECPVPAPRRGTPRARANAPAPRRARGTPGLVRMVRRRAVPGALGTPRARAKLAVSTQREEADVRHDSRAAGQAART